jgi:hypothetical protein
MKHLPEEQIMDAHDGTLDAGARAHLAECSQCRARLDRWNEFLDSMPPYPAPERDAGYGAQVWNRLVPHLPLARPRNQWIRWWTVAPALAALLALAFVAGILTQQRNAARASAKARERVLLIALSDHLERSQIVLAELVNGTGADLAWERERARDLVSENRLLRQTAARAGDVSDAALLDELERALLDIANSPSDISSDDLENLQRRIRSEGLLFKVRITTTDIREKGQTL